MRIRTGFPTDPAVTALLEQGALPSAYDRSQWAWVVIGEDPHPVGFVAAMVVGGQLCMAHLALAKGKTGWPRIRALWDHFADEARILGHDMILTCIEHDERQARWLRKLAIRWGFETTLSDLPREWMVKRL